MIEITEMTNDAMVILKSGKGAPMLLLHRLLVGTDGRPWPIPGSWGREKIQTADGNDPDRISKNITLEGGLSYGYLTQHL